jgi:hypothetical protein
MSINFDQLAIYLSKFLYDDHEDKLLTQIRLWPVLTIHVGHHNCKYNTSLSLASQSQHNDNKYRRVELLPKL